MIIATLFRNPMLVSTDALLWLLIPLCASVAIIYKTIRTENIRRLPLEILVLFVFMIAGLVALGAGLWAVQVLWL